MSFSVTQRIDGIRVVAVLPNNEAGTGILHVESADSVSYQCPGEELEDDETREEFEILPGHMIIVSGTSGDILVTRSIHSESLDVAESAIIQYDGLYSVRDTLLLVQAAIRSALKYQSMGSDAGSHSLASLDSLRSYERQLLRAYNTERGHIRILSPVRMG